jgi:Xaa-Pro aminopeptidase
LSDLITFKPYLQIFNDLPELQKMYGSSLKLWIDPRCSVALQEAAGGESGCIEARSPILYAKAIKTEAEIEGFRKCHIRDSIALCKYFAWLEEELVVKKNANISEVDGADKLEEYRKELSDFMGLSFDTISGSGSNGAIIHYKPEKHSCSKISVDEMYLCDSGGQFMDGTTDVTRTMHFGTPTDYEKETFTRVLKGHIQLDMAVFPQGTTGYILDVLARTSLWKAGLDFRHGTGHGVGSFLNVHEGPQGIAYRISCNDTPLEAGMTVTNEPGYYEDGKFGIRIENVMIVKQVKTPYLFGDRPYLGFEHVTVVPIQTKLIKKELLTSEELNWINDYHAYVFEKVSGHLDASSAAYRWLLKETKPLET